MTKQHEEDLPASEYCQTEDQDMTKQHEEDLPARIGERALLLGIQEGDVLNIGGRRLLFTLRNTGPTVASIERSMIKAARRFAF